jgi:hypothetical protein
MGYSYAEARLRQRTAGKKRVFESSDKNEFSTRERRLANGAAVNIRLP